MYVMLLTLSFALGGCEGEKNDTAVDGDADTDTDTDTDTDAEPVVLRYDDGRPDSNSSPWGSEGHAAFAVHFTAPDTGRLTRIAYFVGRTGIPRTTFDVEVWGWSAVRGLPSAELLYEAEATPENPSWLLLDVSDEDIRVPEQFSVAMEFTTPPGDDGTQSLLLGTDTTDPDGRSFVRWTDRWASVEDMFGFEADWMIRATVEPD